MEDYSKYTTQELAEKIYTYETHLEYIPELIGDLYRMKINIRRTIDELIKYLKTNKYNVVATNWYIALSFFLYHKCKKLPNKDVLLPKIRNIFVTTYDEYVQNVDIDQSMKEKLLGYKELVYVNGTISRLLKLN